MTLALFVFALLFLLGVIGVLLVVFLTSNEGALVLSISFSLLMGIVMAVLSIIQLGQGRG